MNASPEEFIGAMLADPKFAAAYEDTLAGLGLIERLRMQRLRRGLSFRALAAQTHLSFSTVCRMEREDSDPRLSQLMAYARGVGLVIRITVEPADKAVTP